MYASKKMPTIFRKKLIVMTKFPDISLTLVKWPKFPDIFSKFPDNSLTWRKFCFSLTFPWQVATLQKSSHYRPNIVSFSPLTNMSSSHFAMVPLFWYAMNNLVTLITQNSWGRTKYWPKFVLCFFYTSLCFSPGTRLFRWCCFKEFVGKPPQGSLVAR